MKILIIGQTTLHWGRMEYGNTGNYYIIEPFVKELHKVFPNAELRTTLQMSDDFCHKEKIARLPMELYYSWDNPDYLINTIKELGLAELYNISNTLLESTTPYINEVLDSDLVIDFSGDIWGDNANFLGENRFLIGLMKDRIAQLLGKKTVMLAGSPGPFGDRETLNFAKVVYKNFDLVTNREGISTDLLAQLGFDLDKTKTLSCPAFLFEPIVSNDIYAKYKRLKINSDDINIGFIICGWNLLKGPFDRWPIEDRELINYVKLIESIINKKGVNVILMSHSNGFDLPPNFKLKHGRDFPFAERLYKLIIKRKRIDINKIKLQWEVLDAWEIKAFIGKLDMLVSGRVHGAVAGMSQFIPTIMIDYGHEPKAHKLLGFAKVAGMEKMLVDPQDEKLLIEKVNYCFDHLDLIKSELEINIPIVQELARDNFKLLKSI